MKKKNPQDATRGQMKWKLSKAVYARNLLRLQVRITKLEIAMRSLMGDNLKKPTRRR